MPIAHDADSNATAAESSSISWSHTCTGSDRCLTVHVSDETSTAITGVTYNGVSMTAVAAQTTNTSSRIRHYQLVAPATGTNTISVTLGGQANFITCGASSYTGVDQTTPVDATSTGTTGNSSTATDSVTTVTDGAMVVGGGHTGGEGGGGVTATVGTLIYSNSVEGQEGYAAFIIKASAGAQAITFSNNNDTWACQSFALRPVAVVAGSTVLPNPIKRILHNLVR